MNAQPSTSVVPTEDEIARRARQLWDERGRPSGCDVEIWLEAQRQLMQQRAVTSPVATAATKKSPRVRRSAASKDIDQEEVADRLADYGEPPRRSATSVDLT